MTVMGVRENLEAMLADGRDSALLRFSLGQACLGEDDATAAVAHLEQAVVQDPGYSAAWKLLGRARLAGGDGPGAATAWREGIEVANRRGDVQARREMEVFLRRLQKQGGAGGDAT